MERMIRRLARISAGLAVCIALLATASALLAFQGLRLPGMDTSHGDQRVYDTRSAEFAFTRFRYGDAGGGFFARGWWATDYPKADRQFILGIRRLTRIRTAATENVADALSDELYNWAWVYVEQAGGVWSLSAEEAARLRAYMLRGGFVMLDDIHGDFQLQAVLAGVRMIFPDRPIEDLSVDDPIFHVLYDLDDRMQVPGTRYLGARYPPDSAVPKWFGVRDDRGRVVLTICHNSDVGDAWEWADSPQYPEAPASFAYRLGINYIMYALTH
jgi:hypothetical protein